MNYNGVLRHVAGWGKGKTNAPTHTVKSGHWASTWYKGFGTEDFMSVCITYEVICVSLALSGRR